MFSRTHTFNFKGAADKRWHQHRGLGFAIGLFYLVEGVAVVLLVQQKSEWWIESVEVGPRVIYLNE